VIIRGLCFTVACTAISLALGAANSEVVARVADNFGNEVTDADIILRSSGGVVQIFQGKATSVPYGGYEVTVNVAGFKKARLDIVIDQPRQVLSIAMPLGAIEGDTPSCSVTGRIFPEKSATRIRAMQMFGSYFTDVVVDGSGSFALSNLECGEYMFLAIGPKGCLAVQYPRIVRDSRIDFDLRGGNATCVPTIKPR
jgi:hypothetical protein